MRSHGISSIDSFLKLLIIPKEPATRTKDIRIVTLTAVIRYVSSLPLSVMNLTSKTYLYPFSDDANALKNRKAERIIRRIDITDKTKVNIRTKTDKESRRSTRSRLLIKTMINESTR